MAGIYQTFAVAASQLLTGPLGGKGVLRRAVGGGYDDNGEPIPVTHLDLPIACVVRTQKLWNAGAYLGSRLVAVLDNRVKPFPNDQLVVGAQSYTVVEVMPKAPAGVVINYEAVLS